MKSQANNLKTLMIKVKAALKTKAKTIQIQIKEIKAVLTMRVKATPIKMKKTIRQTMTNTHSIFSGTGMQQTNSKPEFIITITTLNHKTSMVQN